jgi:hypothetical protein
MKGATILASIALALTLIVGGFVFHEYSKTTQQVGAVPGPEDLNPYHCVAGVCTYYYHSKLAVASTTCSFKSPAATTSLRFAAAKVTKSSTGATLQYEWGKSSSPNATTSSFGIGTIVSAGQGTITASTTNANTGPNVDQLTVIAPNTYLNLKVGSSTPTDESGVCDAELTAL